MRHYQKLGFWLVLILFSGLVSVNSFSQTNDSKKDTTAKIMTSAQCEMCKKAIEKAVNKLSGISAANLDVESKVLTVTYNTKTTTLDDIRKSVNGAGYDADSSPAEKRAYNKLSKCCKKSE